MADLRTDYKDDVLNINTNERRKYRMINNADGTISFEDVTDYMQNGDSFGSNDVNAITERVNRSLTSADVVDNLESTATKLPLSANMGRILYGEDISSDCVYPYAIGNVIADVSAFKKGRHYSISFKINLASLSDKVYVATIKSDYCPATQIAINVICSNSSTYTYYPASGFILRNGNIYVACDAQIDVAFVSMEYDV